MGKRKFFREDYYTKSDLLSRGWNDRLIRLLLPSPVVRRSKVEGHTYYYPKADVAEMEHCSEFQKETVVLAERRLKRERVKESRLRMMQECCASMMAATTKKDEMSRMEWNLLTYMHSAFVATLALSSYDATNQESFVKHIEETMKQLRSFQPKKDKDCVFLMKRMRWLFSMFFRNKTKDAKAMLLDFQDVYFCVLSKCVKSELDVLYRRAEKDEANDFLMMDDFPAAQLMEKSVYQLFLIYYIPYSIEKNLENLVKVNPKDEYPNARSMTRSFIIHVGPTNSGKTYQSLLRLAAAKSGTYLGPLRLLALEVQEKMLEKGVACSLLTGEEEDIVENETHVSSTVEKANLDTHFDVAVIDECQMIGDPQRGAYWTQAILGIQADEIHCCVAPEGFNILKALIEDCGDSYKVERTERFTPLIFEDRAISFIQDIREGDALVAFSKKEVLRIAEFLQLNGKPASIIYGNLPYPARKLQIQRFLDGETKYVVATDAIGMGLNMPIRRILFVDDKKFDGVNVRPLKGEEVRQIAGRAGRKGLYEQGYVGFFDFDHGSDLNVKILKGMYYSSPVQVPCAYLGFSNFVARLKYDTLEVLKTWAQISTKSTLYKKADITRTLDLINLIRSSGIVFSKEIELQCTKVVFDEDSESLRSLYLTYCRNLATHLPPTAPTLNGITLDKYELYCKKLDLYYSFSKVFGFAVDNDWLRSEKIKVSKKIHSMLVAGVSQTQYKKTKKIKPGYQPQKYQNRPKRNRH